MQSRSPKITIKMGGKRPDMTPPAVKPIQETLQNDQNALEEPSYNVGGKVPDMTAPTVEPIQETLHNDQNAVEGPSDNNALDVSSSEYSSDDEDKNKQMVVYDHSLSGSNVVKPVKLPKSDKPRAVSKKPPEVGAFTVQCANCLKWRLIPDQEKYEVIRERFTDVPFTCDTTRQWNRVVSCDDPTDIEQDGTRVWAIDKPDIARPPPGWKRILRLRNESSSKFADVYYTSPTGAKLRSLPDVTRYFESHPEHAQGIALGRFSFQIPRPLRENYVKKRPKPKAPETLGPSPVEPLAWAGPAENLNLQIAEPLSWAGPMEDNNGMPEYLKTPEVDPENQAAKKAKKDDFNSL
ncbi:methyl-CpG-binding domain-containing protein 2-like [Bidens hawaiensis]|uniref:methyl-CpG-binding domain-containing protein 2-like n=1 Tax=Bidens hawaiensis TaxID=980011 RepID=UPI004048FD71